jgi:predicted RNase H-like HicB family nuclease
MSEMHECIKLLVVYVDTRRFTIDVKNEDEGGFSGRCVELQGAVSQGETLRELEENMKDAIQLIIKSIEQENLGNERQKKNSN